MTIASETKKNIILALMSGLISLVIFTLVIEFYFSFEYNRWKESYATEGDWYGGLTKVSDDPQLMWEYNVNSESNFTTYPNIKTNGYGFRDSSMESKIKPDGVNRIAFIGDSVTLGYKVSGTNTFVKKFSHYAEKDDSNSLIQAMNFGIDGYNTKQVSRLLTTKVLAFNPDRVVYVLCLNDFDFEESSGNKTRYFNKPKSFVLEKVQNLYRKIFKIEFHEWHFRKNKKEVFNSIVAMKENLALEKIRFTIAIVPVFSFQNSELNFSDYPILNIHSSITHFLEHEEIGYLDLVASFMKQSNSPDSYAYDLWHPNESGHDYIAQQLVAFLKPD